ncbi:MAG: peptidase E [Geovibrio sp.]|nr:peptidase E [Geovibrio sp.]
MAGNTFHLLNEAHKTGFDKWLKENIDSKVIVGISAGSIIMTPNIAVASIDDGDENIVGLTDLSGLGFVDFEVSPHTPEDVSVDANKEYAKTISNKLLMLDNNSAVIVKDNHTYLLGGEWA